MQKVAHWILTLLVFMGCASSKYSQKRKLGSAEDRAYLQVSNTLHSSVKVYYTEAGGDIILLGRIGARSEKTFTLSGPYSSAGFTLLAKPNFRVPIRAALPIQLENGKRIKWEVSEKHLFWNEKATAE